MRAALQVCQSRGMDLATLPSQAVHDELHNKVVAVMTDNWWVCALFPPHVAAAGCSTGH